MYCTLPQKNKVSYFLTIKRCILQASLQIFASCPILRVSRLDPIKLFLRSGNAQRVLFLVSNSHFEKNKIKFS
jgi:hypothetical protein